jgi:hypothetical protein
MEKSMAPPGWLEFYGTIRLTGAPHLVKAMPGAQPAIFRLDTDQGLLLVIDQQ